MSAARRPTLLIVDDEENLRVSLGQVLAPDYDVTLCGSAVEALAVLGGGARFDAILCDLMMPRMTGAELYERVAVEAPEALPRMVFLSGGAFTASARDFLDRVQNERLEKPFAVPELIAVLRRVIGE